MNITVEEWSQTGLCLVDNTGKMVEWAGAILIGGEDGVASVIACFFCGP